MVSSVNSRWLSQSTSITYFHKTSLFPPSLPLFPFSSTYAASAQPPCPQRQTSVVESQRAPASSPKPSPCTFQALKITISTRSRLRFLFNALMTAPTLFPNAPDLSLSVKSQVKIHFLIFPWFHEPILFHTGHVFLLLQSTRITASSTALFTSFTLPSLVPMQHPPSHLARNNKHPSLRRRVLPPAVQSPRRAPSRR